MTRAIAASLVTLALVGGCTGSDGHDGVAGPAGHDGPMGAPGATSDSGSVSIPDGGTVAPRSAVIWKDSTGAVVHALGGLESRGFVQTFDSAGNVWAVDGLGVPHVWAATGVTVWFSGDGCTGTPYVSPSVPARFTFTTANDPGTPRVLSDNATPQTVGMLSTVSAGFACSSLGSVTNETVYALSDTRTVTAPASASAPIHPEYLP
jgi:hypothetical protein